MKTKSVLFTLLSLTLLAGATVAAGDGEKRQLKADAIYNEIMQTLPAATRTRIDSSAASTAGRTVNDRTAIDTGKNLREFQEKAAMEKTRRLEALPDEVRRQVEKAMLEMEKRQAERVLEFKEMKRERR